MKDEYLINQVNIDNKTNDEDFIGKNNNEIIIISILKQIISNAIYGVQSKEINEKMKLHCCNYVINSINTFLKTKYLVYDNELDKNKGKIFFDYKPQKFDEPLFIIGEPKTPDMDRNNSNMIKVEKISPEINLDENINLQKTSLNELIKLENSSINESSKTNNIDISISKKNIKKRRNLLKSHDSNNSNNEKSIINLSFSELEEEKYINDYMAINNSKEFNILRIQKANELLQKKSEKNSPIKEIPKIIKKINDSRINKYRKIPSFDFKKFAFDSKGNIIRKKIISNDNLVKDFFFVKSKIENKKIKLKKILQPKENIKNIEDNNYEQKFNKISEDINEIKLENNDNNREALTERTNIPPPIIYNPKDKENIFHYLKYRKINDDNKKVYLYNYCVDNLVPDTGVLLKTKLLKKFGGKNYFMKYNKPSMKEFNKLILSLSSSKLNSFPENILKNFDNENSNINSNEKSDENSDNNENIKYNGYNQKFEENNPLIKGAHTIIKKTKETNKKLIPNIKGINWLRSSSKSNILKKKILSTDNKYKSNLYNDNFSNSMKLSNNIQLSSNFHYDSLYKYINETNISNDFNFFHEIKGSQSNYRQKSSKDILKNIIPYTIKNKKMHFSTINDKIKEKISNNNTNFIDSMEKFNKKIIKDINSNIWGAQSEIRKNQNAYNNIIKSFSMKYKIFNLKRKESLRERKSAFMKIKNNIAD